MSIGKARSNLVRFVSAILIWTGFVQSSWAGVIGTEYLLEADVREASRVRVEALLARDEVAAEMRQFGVDEAMIQERLQGLTHTELLALEGKIDQQIAGGDALGVIGAVFLVLVILELVGITDVFKAI